MKTIAGKIFVIHENEIHRLDAAHFALEKSLDYISIEMLRLYTEKGGE